MVVLGRGGGSYGRVTLVSQFPLPIFLSEACPLPSELGTHKTVTARFWPWLAPFFRPKSLKPFKLFPSRSAAVNRATFFIDSCITQLKAQGPSRTSNESKEEEEEDLLLLLHQPQLLKKRSTTNYAPFAPDTPAP